MAHYDIYRDRLAIAHPSLGQALWNPAPEGAYGSVKVGDVGYVRDGRFFRLFNALLPADHPSHRATHLPEYHEPLIPSVPDHIFKGVLKPNHYCSAGVTVEPEPEFLATGPPEFTRASFSCRRRRGGALLSLPVDTQCQDTRARGDFGKWMLKHIDRWLAFVRGLGLGVEQMEEIILVTGCDCTRSWANVAFLDGQTDARASLGVRVIQGHDIIINWQFLPGNSQGAVCNWGPEGQNLREDQCVFIRGFRVVRVLGILPRQLKGAAEPNPSPDGDNEPDKELMSIPASTKSRDPLNVLLDYVVERAPDCDMVLVHDDDLSRIGQFHDGDEALQHSLMTYLQRTQPEIQQVPCETITVAMFSKEFQQWDPTQPRPSTVGSGQPCVYDPDQLMGQLPEASAPASSFGDDFPEPDFVSPSYSDITLTNSVMAPPSRKRRLGHFESGDDDDVILRVDSNLPQPKPNRLSGACTYCKRLKMKCYFPPGENICKRCRSGKHDCIIEGRKLRSLPTKRQHLLAQLRQKDELINSLLKQLHNPYLATPVSIEAYRAEASSTDQHRQDVIAWLDRLQSSVHSSTLSSDTTTDPFQLDERAGKSSGQQGKSLEEQASRVHMQSGHASSGWEDMPASHNNLPELDINPYPVDNVPIGLLASIAIRTSRETTSVAGDKTREENATGDDGDLGVASKAYFMPGPALNLSLRKSLIDKTSPPEILLHKLVTPDDVEKLFDIFFTRINPFISLLEPKLHTPAMTFSRLPLLFTVVCATALRYSDKPEAYSIAMQFAKSAAADAIINGQKSVELCQAYILMSNYDVPTHRLEEDRNWLYTGLAIRIATDLSIHRLSPKKPTTEQHELEMLNRSRTWINCFTLDKSTATLFGKPSTLKEDYIVRNSLVWYKSSVYNHPYDTHTVAYTSLFRIVNQFQEMFSASRAPNGLNRWIDWRAVTLDHDRMLINSRQEWAERFKQDSDHTDAACEFRVKLLPFYSNYARLVVLSLGFEKTFKRDSEVDDEVFTRSLESAKAVVTTLVDSLVPTGYIRFAPDNYFVMAAFASVFMLKLLGPECTRFITPGLQAEIYRLIERLINTIGSPQVAIDERHTPKLYSRFLASLLAKHKRDSSADRSMFQKGMDPSTPAYWQQLLRHTGSTPIASSFSSASAPHLPQPVELDSKVKSLHEFMDAVPAKAHESGHSIVDASPDLACSDEDQRNEPMDSTLEPFAAPGNEDMLATMQETQNPTWWKNMMMPGFAWPTLEPRITSAPLEIACPPEITGPSSADFEILGSREADEGMKCEAS